MCVLIVTGEYDDGLSSVTNASSGATIVSAVTALNLVWKQHKAAAQSMKTGDGERRRNVGGKKSSQPYTCVTQCEHACYVDNTTEKVKTKMTVKRTE
jgi:hypothetical protein